ncbi:unnamed protein product [Rotaria sordida]|uniref:HAT C-terminal dimerisation domain-containing protein n=2 Tax=Rotaria sordida TaxID=392033 RepID=A0A820AYX0_9BILA|nr:unnamed protein product [Rotaria sordida]CAF4167169.1 unnamed protein product [Rotaria sordida]CAF4194730.1 unnamed protein product [Rotaria sordida]
MSAVKIQKENIKKKIEEGVFKTCSKPKLATASWWNTFVRITDERENIIPFVQCLKCLSIFSYEANKTGSSTHRSHAQCCFGGGAPSPSRNQDISTLINKNKNMFAGAKSTFTEACAKFCAYDLRPFEIVNGYGFEVLCQSILDLAHQHPHLTEARSIISDPTTISRRVKNLAEEHRLALIETLLPDLKKIKLFGVTTDFWKNKLSSESYLTVNVHYNKNGYMKHLVLKTVLVNEAKTGGNILMNILRSFGIDPDAYQIIYVTDNGSNLISALDGEAHIRCICHCINLAVSQSLEQCPMTDLLVSECRQLVEHFKRCELQSKLALTLKQDICTRWNSTYDTLWSIWLNYEDVEEILANRKEEKFIVGIDRYLIKEVTDLLSVFKIGSEKLSADDTPTLHSVLPWFSKFKKTCEPKNTDTSCIVQFKKKLLEKLDDKMWISEIHYISTFLHPETKSLATLTQTQRNEVVQSVKKMLKTVGIVEEKLEVIPTNDNDERKKRRNKRAKRDDITVDDVLKEFVSNENLSNDDDDPYDEVIEYMKSKVNYENDEDVLSWWKKHSCIYPQLSRLAAALLSIPSSSASSERIFSEAGRILEARRQQLNPESLDSLVFLRNFR